MAQHSLLATRLAPPEQRLHVLLHDTHEAWSGDLATPSQKAIDALAPGFRRAFTRARSSIDRRLRGGLGIPAPDAAPRNAIHRADGAALQIELRTLVRSQGRRPRHHRGTLPGAPLAAAPDASLLDGLMHGTPPPAYRIASRFESALVQELRRQAQTTQPATPCANPLQRPSCTPALPLICHPGHATSKPGNDMHRHHAYLVLSALAIAALLLIPQLALAQDLQSEGCKLVARVLTLAKWVRNVFLILSVLILIFLGVAGYAGRFNWKHLAILGGSAAFLAVAHFVPPYFFENSGCDTTTSSPISIN